MCIRDRLRTAVSLNCVTDRSIAQCHPEIYVIGPDSSTNIPTKRIPDILDIVVVKDMACPIIVYAMSDFSPDHDLALISVRPTLNTPLQPPHHVRRVNWYSYNHELYRTVLFDPSVWQAANRLTGKKRIIQSLDGIVYSVEGQG